MILPNKAQVYIKTTETCQLNCKHCFTNGKNGKKIFFNPDRTVEFLSRLKNDCSWIKGLSFIFHGGEPMLAPLKDLISFKEKSHLIFPESTYSIQTNLVYKIAQEHIDFFKSLSGIGISWDYDIRFEYNVQRRRWKNNVELLKKYDLNMTMVVSITNNLVKDIKAIEVVSYAADLGFKHILFERITLDGNAVENASIIPKHEDVDEWCYQMYQDTLEGKWHEKIDNMMLASIAEGIVNHNNVATSCRNCEQTLVTINADGTIAGCPNSAPRENWGSIDMRVFDVLKSPQRQKSIMCEATKNPICYTCEHLPVCNGGCHRLAWQGDRCPAPKLLFKEGASSPKKFEVLLW